MRNLACVCILTVVFSLVSQSLSSQEKWKFAPAFPHLDFENPLYLTYPPDGTNRLFVVEQAGRVYWFENNPDVRKSHLAVDISAKVRTAHTEEGLLGMAFHPEFKRNGYVFLHYSASRPRRNVLSRFVMNSKRTRILRETESVILEVAQPYGNHNGGMIAFGPEGYLYIALGDGGGAGDPHGNGQNKNVLLAKLLRIDINRRQSGRAYAIPEDNPFVHEAGARGEIWAYGLRNPWRFSFDRKTNTLWAGDVGQDRREEIDIIEKGRNYGWNLREGSEPFAQNGPTNDLVDPIVDHARHEARSITGGYVYRGKRFPELDGAYIYGDYGTGNIWILRSDGRRTTDHRIIAKGDLISSFGEDRDGEIYYTSLAGKVYTLTR